MRATPLLTAAVASALALAWAGPPSAADAKDDKKAPVVLGTIERKDPRFDQLIAKDAVVEKLADGFIWAEGPVWVKRDGGFLLFSDIPNNRVNKWQEGKGVSVFV